MITRWYHYSPRFTKRFTKGSTLNREEKLALNYLLD